MKHFTLAFLFLLALTACKQQPKVKTVTIKNLYSIEVPEPFTPIANLNDDASLEYGNNTDEFYVIVIDEPKTEFRDALETNDLLVEYECNLDGYTDLLISSLEQNIANFSMTGVRDTTINNLPAKLVNITGRTAGVDVYFQYAFVEGRAHFYQVMTWASPSRKDRYINAMNKMVRSLKEL